MTTLEIITADRKLKWIWCKIVQHGESMPGKNVPYRIVDMSKWIMSSYRKE